MMIPSIAAIPNSATNPIAADTLNGGDAAVLYCFVFLYLALAGGGEWSLDRLRQTSPVARERSAHSAG